MKRQVSSRAERYFSTGLSLITSRGKQGTNVMTAEWVLQISYNPKLIAIFIHEGSKTLANIIKTREFGVNVASEDQVSQVSTAGGYSRSELDKMQIADLFKTSKPHKIKTPMIIDCTINAECRLVMKKKTGDHVMLVGQVVDIKHDDTKNPLVYHRAKYWKLGSALDTERITIKTDYNQFNFFKNLAGGSFVLKCVGLLVQKDGKIMVQPFDGSKIRTIPFSIPRQGEDYGLHLSRYLKKSGIKVRLESRPVLKRIILKNGKEMQRINFVLYHAKMVGKDTYQWELLKQNRIVEKLALD